MGLSTLLGVTLSRAIAEDGMFKTGKEMHMNPTDRGAENLPPTKLTVELSCRETSLYLRLIGALVDSSAVALQAVTGQISRSNFVTLDLGALMEIDAVGYEALVSLSRQVRATGARLKTVGVEGRVAQILSRFGCPLPPHSGSCRPVIDAPSPK